MAKTNTAPVRAEEGMVLDRILTLELVRVTERTAIAAARLRGRGDEITADRIAVETMHRGLSDLPFAATVVIGEGAHEETDRLWLGEKIGTGREPIDIAALPLEGTTICAKDQPNSISLLAVAEPGTLLETPEVYMEKIAIGSGYPDDLVNLDRSPAENLRALAEAKRVPVGEITACILDRPRHARLIEEVRATGAAIRLIGDGDVAGVIQTTESGETGVDIYMGSGGAPEGILAACALKCIGGQMQGRLILDRPDKVARARDIGITDPHRIYRLDEMVRGDVVFAATGITDGSLLAGVRFGPDHAETQTVVMRASTGTVRWIRTRYPNGERIGQ